MSARVKTAKKRKPSSTEWLKRQLNDPYVQRAKREGYRSRAAYKLIELDEKFGFLKRSKRIVDLGAAPGGWSQVARQRCRPETQIVALDMLEMDPLAGVTLLQADFMDQEAPALLKEQLHGTADLVLSDMSPNTSGTPSLDHLRILGLVEAAFDFACEILAPGGTFVAKVFQGGTEKELLARIRQRFERVKHAKPAASRKDSAETYLVAMGFKSTSY